jgi:ribosomal protein S18 acetylase RimI-like enzyme
VTDFRVERLRTEDLPAVVQLHTKAFADSAITALGPEAVRRYYGWLLEGPHDAALVGAWRGTQLVGFCAAGVFRGAMNGFLRANRRYLAAHIATHPWLLLSPLIRDRLLLAARITVRFSRKRQRSAPQPPAEVFGILSIATDPAVRGSGSGRALMLEAEHRATAAGFERMVLTVHPQNSRAVAFYEQLGWVRSNEPSGAWSGEMTKRLQSA